MLKNALSVIVKIKDVITCRCYWLPIVVLVILVLLQIVSLKADEKEAAPIEKASKPLSSSLPDPLTLEYALSLVNENNPVVSLAQNRLFASQTQTKLLRSDLGLNLAIKARARWIESPEALRYLGREDHAAKVALNKTLYDFGRTSNKLLASNLGEEVSNLQLQNDIQNHRLRVMQAFFDVLLADLIYARDNEAMAMGFIYYDKTKERASLGQRSALDVLEKDSAYQATRQARYESDSNRRLARNNLSLLLNRPDKLPSKLTIPSLEYHKLNLKEVDELQAAALKNNLELKILNARKNSLMHELKSIRSQRSPTISAEVESGIYQREIGTNDTWRAGLTFEVPLYQGGKVTAQAALKKNEIEQLQIIMYQKELEIKQNTLTHWLALTNLQVKTLAANTLYDYREYYLDRARALYEMEVKSDLGDSMVELSAASLKVAEAQFETAMRWEILAQLTQMSVTEMSVDSLKQ